jgi:hypothetical protein
MRVIWMQIHFLKDPTAAQGLIPGNGLSCIMLGARNSKIGNRQRNAEESESLIIQDHTQQQQGIGNENEKANNMYY